MKHLYNKYKIEKADGSPVDPDAMYFVLRIDTDPHACVALRAYARSIRASDPDFADELDEWIESRPRELYCPFGCEFERPNYGVNGNEYWVPSCPECDAPLKMRCPMPRLAQMEREE